MALSRKISKPEIQEDKIEELILKGGSSGKENNLQEKADVVRKVQLRISTSKLNAIDILIKKRVGNVSRHTWIMEAIEEKLGKENS